MESLRNVISKLFTDAQDSIPLVPQENDSQQNSECRMFKRRNYKRRRLQLLHPELKGDTSFYDNSTLPVSLYAAHLDYDALVSEFSRAVQYGSLSEHLKVIILKYREPPFSLSKTVRLLKFLHHLLRVYPITPIPHDTTTHKPPTFPLGQVLEDLTLTLSLRTIPQVNHLFQQSAWIVTLQFMISCLKSNSPALLYNSGITTPVILGMIKHVLLELTRLTPANLDSLQQSCFDVCGDFLDVFLVRPEAALHSISALRVTHASGYLPAVSIGTVSFYDVIYSFPELYGHFQTASPSTTVSQPSIMNSNIWNMTIRYLTVSIQQDARLLDRIPTVVAINIIKHILREINTLPSNLSTAQAQCLNSGKELINLLLLGPSGDGAGVVEYYDIILALPDVYGHFLRGTFAQSIHWTMEKFVNELGKRRRHLAFLMMPPDASWPLISQLSRRHEYNDLTTRTSYHMFEGDLIEFVKEGNSTNIETHFRDMLFQRASMDEFRQLAMSLTQSGLDTTLIRKAMVSKVRDVIQCLQYYNFKDAQTSGANGANSAPSTAPTGNEEIKMMIPSNLHLWELMTETADQLYSFVSAEFFTYEDILQDFYDLVYDDENEAFPPGTKNRVTKDNGLVWLLLQLFYIDRVAVNVIEKDFETDERLFEKLVKLYNEDQIFSKDGFSLRDLSLQCAINLQKDHIKDITNIKQRHPGVTASLRYAGMCYQIQAYFSNHYHSNVPTNSTLFQDMSIQEMTVVACESQLRQDIVPYALYVYLVPTKQDVETLGHPGTTFVKGGTINYKLLDLISINAKQRLLQVIYKMMLDSELGPRYQSSATNMMNQQPHQQNRIHSSSTINCVPPYVLDVVYKLLYSAPCSAELMIREIFEKLRRCDKIIKLRYAAATNPSSAHGDVRLPDHTMRWMHTMLQLINYRFIRFLKYSPMSIGMFHHVRYAISALDHRQVYHVLESFIFNLTLSQVDVILLRSLDDPNREKEIWFAESEKLARAMVCTIARLIKTRGQADIATEQIHRVLAHLYEHRLEWSPETIKFFPEAVSSFYANASAAEQLTPPRTQVSLTAVNQLVTANRAYISFLEQGVTDNETGLLQYFSSNDRQSLVLCSLWAFSAARGTLTSLHMASIRKLLLCVQPARMATCIFDFSAFILSMEYPSLKLPFHMLNTMIWDYQWININDLLLGLLGSHHTGEASAKALKFVDFLLKTDELQSRVDKWTQLKFSTRPWTEEDAFDKLMEYHKAFPEYFEFEAFAAGEASNDSLSLDPPLQLPMPIYYTNFISDFTSTLESVIGYLIERNQAELLVDVLDKFGCLFHYHQYPLSFVCNTLLYYHSSPILQEPRIVRRIARLLDFDQYDIAPEAVEYATDDTADVSKFDSCYFEKVVNKLAKNMNPQKCAPKTKLNLPERHFREIGNPAIEGISIATLEILITPVQPNQVINYILDMTLLRRPQYVGVSALTIHTVGLLISSLPPDAFLRPVFEELNQLIMSNSNLSEVSEPCRMIRCSVPKRANGKYVMSQSLPDLTTAAVLKESMSARFRKAMTFPYIFNDYTFNLHNYSTNEPNSFLTLFHSILHYSSLDGFTLFLEYLRTLRLSGELQSDVQLLYICALLGPALHRIEKLESTDAECMIELMNMVKQVTAKMDMKDGWVTQALEQVFDFLYHIRARFVKSTELTSQLRTIIKTMNAPVSHRLLRLLS
ncbi:hypothetical protein DM01DRAFT_1337353 [Hesseltinella vesiculosa]|uniref:Mediator of RNA polymerase II transcription subunit 23 n=1 Tax=Hesseltinella vesiculosa TaxID=101127 RepID=A0A1X2GDM5_9FUNG|nr:hypothetical protein DM01DRAFT_1337353 [Hesseltinella vesiculosa]